MAAIAEVNRSGIGWLVPYSEPYATAGGKAYIFVRRDFELSAERGPK
ncbi:MAG: hypothetical protein ACREQI_02280 [Candidatus Binataceae bacterium]